MFDTSNQYFESYVLALSGETPIEAMYAAAKNELFRLADSAETDTDFSKIADLREYCSYLESILAAHFMRLSGYYVDNTKYLPEWVSKK